MGRAEAGALLAFPVADAELDRWHRRVLTARVAVLHALWLAPPRLLRIAEIGGQTPVQLRRARRGRLALLAGAGLLVCPATG